MIDLGIKKGGKDVLHLVSNQNLHPLHEVSSLKINFKKDYFLFINQHCLLQVRDDPCSVHKEEKEERYHGRGFARGERNQDQSVHQRRHGRLGGGPR